MGGRRVGGLGRVGPYTMVERLGRGGMGDVYLAVGRRGVKVAVKMLRDPIGDDPDARLRLDREVRALRRVESPYVARVLDADLSGDRPYLVMEHIEGETLLDKVRRSGPLSGANLIELARGLATAIAIIHAAGVIHRDVKPANVVLGPDGPVLIDFGIAQVADATRVTMTGTFLGTPGYSAPEVFAEEPVEEPSDVHSWAATVAFAATGRPTFGRGSVEAQMYAVLNGRADLAGVPGLLLPLIRAALNREPGKRPTAALLADRLSRLARATAPATPVLGAPPRRDEPPSGRVRDEPARVRGDDPPGGRGRAGEPSGARPRGEDTPGGRGRSGEQEQPDEAATSRAPEAAEAATDGVTPPPRKKTTQPRPSARTGVPGERVRVRRAEGPERRAKAEGAEHRPRAEEKARRAGGEAKEAQLAAEAVQAGGSTAPGSAMLVVLAMVAVPCVVASVIWPLATFVITAAFCVLARAWWTGHWLVRNRRSPRVRGTLRVVTLPVTLSGALLSAALWPGLPASAIAASAFWVAAGGHMDDGWWNQAGPMTVAGVVFGVVCGGIVGREIERVGDRAPDLRREGLRALSVLGGFVALCAAAVRVLAWIIPHAL
ncbi:serine/threonine protein kinase [Sphaerisporangium fuscum]|uniref:serine/threonine protein kinase n=1 Tax=Sphaerisporangium fuscum TaxID=2835868 RepID=UPI001BDD7C90|nr:serine/threonine-protein kinase [Sphaerisporangium fuscum]